VSDGRNGLLGSLTIDMIKRLIENRLTVDFLCHREKALHKCNLILDAFDRKWLSILNEVLKIYKHQTTLVSKESYPTLSVQLPEYWVLATELRAATQSFDHGAEEENATHEHACQYGWKTLKPRSARNGPLCSNGRP
jgi:hypothetical protein